MEEAQQLYRVEKEKCEELKKELTAVQSQLSEMQGFTDKQKSFCSLSAAINSTLTLSIRSFVILHLQSLLNMKLFSILCREFLNFIIRVLNKILFYIEIKTKSYV